MSLQRCEMCGHAAEDDEIRDGVCDWCWSDMQEDDEDPDDVEEDWFS